MRVKIKPSVDGSDHCDLKCPACGCTSYAAHREKDGVSIYSKGEIEKMMKRERGIPFFCRLCLKDGVVDRLKVE